MYGAVWAYCIATIIAMYEAGYYVATIIALYALFCMSL